MRKFRFSKKEQKSKKFEKGVPSDLISIIHTNLYLLYMNREVKNVF